MTFLNLPVMEILCSNLIVSLLNKKLSPFSATNVIYFFLKNESLNFTLELISTDFEYREMIWVSFNRLGASLASVALLINGTDVQIILFILITNKLNLLVSLHFVIRLIRKLLGRNEILFIFS